MDQIRATSILVLLLFASPAFAHAIRMKVEITDSQVRATVRYDGADEDGGPVEIQLMRREPLHEMAKIKPGTAAVASFPRPEPGRYRMIAQDDFGHRVVVDFEVPPAGIVDPAGTSDQSSPWNTLAGLGFIAVIAVTAWWFTGRKKQHGS